MFLDAFGGLILGEESPWIWQLLRPSGGSPMSASKGRAAMVLRHVSNSNDSELN
jgi:hypothetical protein